MEAVIESVFHAISEYGEIAIFFAVFFTGENAIIAVFALAAQGFLNPISAGIICYLGSVAADVFWFLAGRGALRPIIISRFLKEEEAEAKSLGILNFLRKHTFIGITFIKFLVGVRLFLTLYISVYLRISFWRYLILNVIGTIFFFCVLFPIGWYLGRGVSGALSATAGVKVIGITVIAVLVLVHFLPKLIGNIIKLFKKD